jgi:hypothetical protein
MEAPPVTNARPPPRVVAYGSLAEVAPLAPRLDALNLASRRPSPFDTFAYIEAFAAHDEFAAPGQRLLFLVAFDGDAPVGFLPLRRVPQRVWGIRSDAIQLLMTHDHDRPRTVARPEDEARCAAAFYRYLFEVERGWSVLVLTEQDAASALRAPPPGLDLRHHYRREFPTNPNGTIELPYHSLGEYLRTFSKTHRRNAERWVRRLMEAGALEVVSSADPRALPGLLELYLDLERRSWKAGVGGHIGRHPERVAFFRQLLEPGRPLQVAIRLLLLDGVPIAGFVSGAFGDGLYGLEIAFDEGYRELSPGNAVLLFALQDAIEKRYRFVNMLGNYAYYKSRWHATITETSAVQVFRKGTVVHVKALAGELRRRLRPPVSQHEVGFNLARPDAEAEPAAGAAAPERGAERERARVVLAAMAASGATVTRLAGAALARSLPFEPKTGNARPGGRREARV